MIKKSSKITTKPQGFISIIALGIFAMLMIVAINLRMITEEAISNIKNSLNKGQAENIAFSMTGYLQLKMKNHENGWSTGKVICGFGKYKSETTTEGGGITGFCQDQGLLDVATPDSGKAQKDIKIELEVKGRTTEKINTTLCGKGNGQFKDSCYVTPTPGTGDAGDKTYCKIYKPNITVENTNLVDHSLTNGVANTDQVNYSCNWNKLSFGSSQTDRVAIPLYYDAATLEDKTIIKNPYIDKSISIFSSTAIDKKAEKLIVRLRTPCKPCAEKGETPNPDYQREKICEDTVRDETVCEDGDRYVLDYDPLKEGSDDIVVQWLINGECENSSGKAESCGIMPIPGETSSAIHESSIKYAQNKKTEGEQFSVIDSSTQAHDTNDYPKKINLIKSATIPKLPTIYKPLFTLFLSKPLLTPKKHAIPYLEYQILTDQPVGNSKSTLEASVVVDGNAYKKTLTKQIKVPLIDFAIHN